MIKTIILIIKSMSASILEISDINHNENIMQSFSNSLYCRQFEETICWQWFMATYSEPSAISQSSPPAKVTRWSVAAASSLLCKVWLKLAILVSNDVLDSRRLWQSPPYSPSIKEISFSKWPESCHDASSVEMTHFYIYCPLSFLTILSFPTIPVISMSLWSKSWKHEICINFYSTKGYWLL